MEIEEGKDILVSQAPDPGGNAAASENNNNSNKIDINNSNDQDNSNNTTGRVAPPPPPRHPYKHTRSHSNKSIGSNMTTTTATKTKTSWLVDTLADIRDNLLAADTVSLDGSRHGSSPRDITASSSSSSSRAVALPASPTSIPFPTPPPPPAPPITSALPTTEAELASEWRNKYHHLAQKNAEVETDLLSQLSALSNALYEKTREHEALKKSSDKTISLLKTQVETQQVTLDARVRDLESIQLTVEGQKNTVNRLQRQLDTLVADNNYTLEDTTRVEIERLQAKERENYARLVAFERENKFLVNKLDRAQVEQQEVMEELEGCKAKLEQLHHSQRELEEMQQKLHKSTTSHAADQALLREEQQKYEDLVRQSSLQRREFSQKEDFYQQQISELSSTKAQLESHWMSKCDEQQQRYREDIEDMEYQVETKVEELYIAKQIAAELERKVSSVTEQLSKKSAEEKEEKDRQLLLLQGIKDEKENLLKQLKEQDDTLRISEATISNIQEKSQRALEDERSKTAVLQEKIHILEEEKCTLKREKDEELAQLNAQMINLKDEMHILQEENSFLHEEKDKNLLESEEAMINLKEQIQTLEEINIKMRSEKEEILVESAKTIADLQAKIQTINEVSSKLQEEEEKRISDLQLCIHALEQEVIEHKALAETADKTLKEQREIAGEHENMLNEKISLLMQEISSLTSEHKEQMGFYGEELDQLKLELEEARAGYNSLKKTNQHDIRQRDEGLDLARARITDLELELQTLSADHEQLHNEKESHLSLLIERIVELEHEVAHRKDLVEQEAYDVAVKDITDNKKDLTKELEQQVTTLKLQIESMTLDHQNNIRSLKDEVEHLVQMLEESKNEKDKIKQDLGQQLEDAMDKVKDLEASIESMAMNHNRLVGEKDEEVNSAKQRSSELESQIFYLESLTAEAEKSSGETIAELEEKVKLLMSQKLNEEYYKQDIQNYEHLLEEAKNTSAEIIKSLKQTLQEKNECLTVATKRIADLEASFLSLQEQYQQLKDESASSLSAAEKRAAELEQDIIKCNLQMKGIQEEFEAMLTEQDEKAKVQISELQKEKSHVVALLEEKDSFLSRAESSAKMLRQELDECLVKLENQIANEKMVSSLQLELDEAKDGFHAELVKYKNDINELQLELENSKVLHSNDKLSFATTLEEKNEALLAAENKVIELAKTIASISNELTELQIEQGKQIARGRDPSEQFQMDNNTSLEELKLKLSDRDQTIDALLEAAVAQDEKIASLEEEKETLLENLSVSDVVEIEDKVNQLKTALDESKRNEVALENELQRLRKEIVSLNESNGAMTDLQTTLNEVYSSVSILEKERASLQDTLRESKICMDEKALDLESRLQEKEAVIIKLQKSCVDYEQQLASFQNSPEASQNLSSLESFQKLQDENEIFACQIIEQEEELEQLKSKLEEKNRCYDSLENDMKELRVKLDLLESINASLRDDIEKRKAMVNVGDGEEMQINALETQIEDLEISLASLRRENSSLNDQIKHLSDAKFQRDVASVVHGTSDSEKQKLLENIAEKESIICEHVESVKNKDCKITELELELQRMRRMQNDLESSTIGSFTGNASNRNLEREIADITHQNQILMAKANQVAELTRRLEESENGRLMFEKNNFETFEKKLAMIKLNKDAALDSLRKEIASLKASKKEIEIDFMNQITALESTRNGNRSEIERKMKAKDEVISRLEQQVVSQEQLVSSMRVELEQLRGSMSKANLSRRDEVDEMQEELMDKSAKLKQKEREISALKMKLEEEKLQHADEIAKMRNQLATRGVESATVKGAREIKDEKEIAELKESIQQLRRRNTTLSEENSKLCARIDNLETDKKNIGGTDKWRTSALKDQVKTLMLRVQELEGRHKELRSSGTCEWGSP